MSVRQVIGLHSCREALKQRSPHELKQIYFKADWKKNPLLRDLVSLAESKNLKPKVISEKQMNRLLNFKQEVHQGILLEVDHQFPEINLKELSKKESATLLILDHIQDPRNLGAILRTAWLMSVSCVFLSAQKSVGLTPTVIKSASGAVEHVPVFIKNNFKLLIKELKENSFWLYALSPSAKKRLWEEDLPGKKAFIVGGEHAGIRQSLEKECDEFLSLPQKESSASYNVSVAVGMALYESKKKQDKLKLRIKK